jgi:hypothetical protein
LPVGLRTHPGDKSETDMDVTETVGNALRWIIGILDRHNIQYQITGGFAAKLYGSSREVNDIDIDICEKDFQTILPYISHYLIDGPTHYNDGKWDGEFITINYRGQYIDISAIDSLRITNKERTEWLPYQQSYFESLDIDVNGMKLKILSPRKLVQDKKELDGEHQLIDIQAIEKYCIEHGF